MKSSRKPVTQQHHLKAILFMDVQGYSDLDEDKTAILVKALWRHVAKLVAIDNYQLVNINTWGDAIFAVSECPRRAADLALKIREFFSPKTLGDLLLPDYLTCRISLHAGGVINVLNPIRKCRDVVGAEVNRCARAEPITELGQIFITRAFYEMLGKEGRPKYALEEVGVRELAKGFGAEMLYCLERRSPHQGQVNYEKKIEGVTTPNEIEQSTHRLPGENFCVELLQEPVILEKSSDGKLTVTISRDNVTEVVVSNAGKKYAVDKYVTIENRDELIRWDKELQLFLCGGNVDQRLISRTSGTDVMRFDLASYRTRLRWASGGVLSIVTRGVDRREWVPLFFRDIHPYGWNISLGQAERQFDKHGHKESGGNELFDIARFIEREFLEENIVLDRKPMPPASSLDRVKMGRLDDDTRGIIRSEIEAYHKYYCEHRRDEGDFDILGYGREIGVKHPRLPFTVKVKKSVNNIDKLVDEHGVLVCFSLLDLGIEVVKVKKYHLKADEYLVDGEVLVNADASSDLIKMPMALLSFEYLREMFGDRNWMQKYTTGQAPSIIAKRPPKASEAIVFDWDIHERMRVVRGEKRGTEFHRERFLRWYDTFGAAFITDRGAVRKNALPALFVPGTAKILNTYFCSQ